MTSTEKHISLCICKGSCRQFTFRFPNSCHANRALHLQKISCFLWVVNAAIQPLEKSASKLLIWEGSTGSRHNNLDNLPEPGEDDHRAACETLPEPPDETPKKKLIFP